MRKQHNIIAEAVAGYLARHDSGTPEEILTYLLATARAELEPYYEANFRKGLLGDIRAALRWTALDDGVDEDEPAQSSLPGFRAPTTLAVHQSTGEYRYIRFERCTEADFLHAIATRKEGILHDQRRLEDLERKYRVLRPYLRTSATMTVGEAIQLYAGTAHAAV